MSLSEPVVGKIVGLFAALDREEVAALPPLQRENFAALCAYWASVAGKRQSQQQQGAGVLASLKNGERQE